MPMSIYQLPKRIVNRAREQAFGFRRKRKLAALDREFDSAGIGNAWPPIPRPSVNFNQRTARNIDEYRHDYLEEVSERTLPFLRSVAKLDESSLTLDFGCGLGRLAAAFATAEPSAGRYLGYEPEATAREWLQRAYERDSRFGFGGSDLPTQMNYATNKGNLATARGNYEHRTRATPDLDALGQLIGPTALDLQFTSSVFTHMWPDDIVGTLEAINNFADKDCLTLPAFDRMKAVIQPLAT